MSERRFVVWWLGLPDIREEVTAATPSQARYAVWLQVTDAGFDARFTDMRCRVVTDGDRPAAPGTGAGECGR